MRRALTIAGLFWLIAGAASCGAENGEEAATAPTQSSTDDTAIVDQHRAEILSACNCKARCSNNPPRWTKWYSRGRASSWGACQDAAVRFCHSWTPPYSSTDASCD